MSEPTARELLLAWKESSIMERRAIEGQMRQRSMPIRLPTEEAIVYALIDWLEDVEKRLAKRPKPKPRKKAKEKAAEAKRYDQGVRKIAATVPIQSTRLGDATVVGLGNGEAA